MRPALPMSTKTPKTSRILDAVHETARDLHSAGLISKRRMKDYDSLCLVFVPEYSSETIRALRERFRISQAVLASILNTSVSTVRQWEIGENIRAALAQTAQSAGSHGIGSSDLSEATL